nr:O-antigen ligase family protein [Tamilnaduibacter salinus]
MKISLVQLSKLISLLLIATISFQNIRLLFLGPLVLSITNLFLLINLVVLLTYVARKEKIVIGRYQMPYVAILSGFGALAVLSCIWHARFEVVAPIASSMLLTLLIVASIREINIRYWEAAILLSAVLAVIFAIGHSANLIPLFGFEGPVPHRGKILPIDLKQGYTGLIGTRGSYGILCILGIVVGLWWWRCGSIPRKLVALSSILAIIFSVALSLSRSTWLAIGITMFAYIPLRWMVAGTSRYNRLNRGVIIAVVVAFIGMWLALYGVPSSVSDSYNLMVSIRERSVESRWSQYQAALDLSVNAPIFGLSSSQMERLFSEHVLHNSMLAVLLEIGIFPLIFFVALHAWLIKDLIKIALVDSYYENRLRAAVWLSGLFGVIVEMSLFRGYQTNMFWVFVGLLVADIIRMRRGVSFKCDRVANSGFLGSPRPGGS